MSSQTLQSSWQFHIAAKREHLAAATPVEWILPTSNTIPTNVLDIPRSCGILSARELNITEKYTADELVQALASGKFTALEVTLAFCKRAAIAQKLISCLTETFYDQAQDRARFLDEYLKTEKKTYGPLHGLPVSLKDSFNVKGVQSTLGYVSFLDHPVASTNSPLVDVLLELGAVLYLKTNIPQTLMTADSENNIFGRTLNPFNTTLTAGGSSGGEGALVAMRGSIFGVGTDIAGSIRIPSLCCGSYGFKPTSGRIPITGCPFGGEGVPGIVPSAGPLTTSFSDLSLFMKTVLEAKPWRRETGLLAVPWRSLDPAPSSLTIGVLAEDREFPLHPPVHRTLEAAVSALSTAGHKLIRLDYQAAISTSLGTRLAFEYFSLDPDDTGIKHIEDSGEPMVQSVQRALPPHKKTYTLTDLVRMNVEVHDYAEAWRKIFFEYKLDAVIAPGAQNTAVEHDTFALPPYTLMWNLLDVSLISMVLVLL